MGGSGLGMVDAQWIRSDPPSLPGRTLAPDALIVIPPAVEYGETFQGPIDLPLVQPQSPVAVDSQR